MADFVQFYKAGKMTLSSDRFAVYDPAVQLRWTNEITKPYKCQEVFFMQGVPFLFPLMVPFSIWSIKVAFWLCYVSSIICGAWGLYTLSSQFSDRRREAFIYILVGILGSLPCWMNFILGQLSWFLLGLISFYIAAFLKGRDSLAACMLALTAIKPQYAILLAIPALVQKRWKLIFYAAAFELALLAMAALCIGFDNVINYPQILSKAVDAAGTNAASMVNIRALLLNFMPDKTASSTSIIIYIGTALALLAYCIKERAKDRNTQAWKFSLIIVACLLTSPHAHLHDCMLLGIPALLTLSYKARPDAPQSFYRCWSALLIAYPALSWILFLTLQARWPLAVINLVFAALIITMSFSYDELTC